MAGAGVAQPHDNCSQSGLKPSLEAAVSNKPFDRSNKSIIRRRGSIDRGKLCLYRIRRHLGCIEAVHQRPLRFWLKLCDLVYDVVGAVHWRRHPICNGGSFLTASNFLCNSIVQSPQTRLDLPRPPFRHMRSSGAAGSCCRAALLDGECPAWHPALGPQPSQWPRKTVRLQCAGHAGVL